VGLQRQAQHPPEERAGVPVTRDSRLRRLPGVVGGEADRAQPAAPRDLKLTPYVLGSVDKDYTVVSDQVVRKGNPFKDRNVGVDVKWGVRPNLTADFTVNTDFAQVEADEEQVNLTRFDLFFPRSGRSPRERVGLPVRCAAAGGSVFLEADWPVGHRLVGRADRHHRRRAPLRQGGRYNIGMLNMQTDSAVDQRTGRLLTAANNFGVVRVQREMGRSNVGAIFVNRDGTGGASGGTITTGLRCGRALQVTRNSKLFGVPCGDRSPATRGGTAHCE